MAKESIEDRELCRLNSAIRGSTSQTEVLFHKERYERQKRLREIKKERKEK